MAVANPSTARAVKTATGAFAILVIVSSLALVGAAADGFTTTQTASPESVAPGNNVTLTVTLDNVSSDANSAGIDIGLPENWSVVSPEDSTLENPGETQVVYSRNKTQYLLVINSTTNTSFTLDYTVSVPESASEGSYTVAANGSYSRYNSTLNASVRVQDNTTTIVNVSSGPPALDGFSNPPADPDSDGLYEDVNGDGFVRGSDAVALFLAITGGDEVVVGGEWVDEFDFNGDGNIRGSDAVRLFLDITG